MDSSDSQPASGRSLNLCPICGEAIGVYEPTVYAAGAYVKRTSLAAEPWLEGSAARTAYHAACWDAHGSSDAAA